MHLAALFFLLEFVIKHALCKLEILGAEAVPQSGCRSITALGNTNCCCNGCGDTINTWGHPCNGDLTGNICASNEVLRTEYDNLGTFGDSKPIPVGSCLPVVDCPSQKWQYNYVCCACPAGYQASIPATLDQCSGGSLCVGCTDPDEILEGSLASGFSCSKSTGASNNPSSSLPISTSTTANPTSMVTPTSSTGTSLSSTTMPATTTEGGDDGDEGDDDGDSTTTIPTGSVTPTVTASKVVQNGTSSSSRTSTSKGDGPLVTGKSGWAGVIGVAAAGAWVLI